MLTYLRNHTDKNLLYIWEHLMNPAARSLATHALLRVLFGSALLITMPYAVGFLIDGMTNQTAELLIVGGLLFFTLKISNIFIGWWRQQVREHFFQEAFWFMPQAISRQYFSRPLAWLSGGGSEIDGGGVESLRDKVWNVTNSYIFQIIPGFTMIGFGLLAITYANVWLGVITFIYIAAHLYIGKKEAEYIYTTMRPVIDQFKRWERRMQEWWRNIDHIKNQGTETKILRQVHDEVQEALRGDDAVWRVYFAKRIVWHRTRDLMFASVLYAGIVYFVVTESLSLAIAVLVFFSYERISSTLADLNDQQRDVQFNLASIAKYRRILLQTSVVTYDTGTEFTDDIIALSFNNVTHDVTTREGNKQILRDVSLTIPTGMKVGVVGPSGAGKSQLLSLLVRATDPVAGTVQLNNHDLRDLKLESLLRYYAVIMQKSEPYEDTILGNLLFVLSHYDLPTAYEDLPVERQVEICALAEIALKKAGLNPTDFDDGLMTNIGYKGLTLSGGQQQRLQIAAAHLKLTISKDRPRLVLADEPTASLDSLSELTVMQHLQNELPDNTTMLMVAHRLSTVANMDKVIFVRPIDVCDSNTPQVTMHDSLFDLYQTELLFRKMADAQHFVPENTK